MNTDKFHVKIEVDGTITVTTDKISPQQHFNAEQFVEFLSKNLGGEHTKVRRAQAHTHEHVHDHTHEKENA